MALPVVSVNVEWNKHHDTLLPFLRETKAQALCIQELLERDIPLYEEAYGGTLVGFSPTGRKDIGGGVTVLGNGIFSRIPGAVAEIRYYVGSGNPEEFHMDDGWSDIGMHALVVADIPHEDSTLRIATTHFTWTPNGQPNEAQRTDLAALLAALSSLGEFALLGDFNAPRGGEIFSALSLRYKDNIPPEYEGSIDVALHKTKDNPVERARVAKYMVDGLFTTPGILARDVRLEFGVSDHAAIVATIEKAP